MPHLSVNGLPPQPQPQPIGPEPGGPQQVGPQQPGGLPGGGDPVVAEVQENGAGWPDFAPGHGQMRHLAQAHDLGSGRDWDIESAQGAAELASKAAKRIRDMVSGETALRQYEQNVSAVLDRLLAAHPDAADAIGPDYAELLRTIGVVRELRATFASGIKDGSNHADDPRAALASIRKHLRIFRYETQQVLSAAGLAAGSQEWGEHAMRAIQNFFTFGAKHHVSLDEFSAIRAAEEEMFAAAGRFCQTLRRLDPQASDPRQPPNLALRHALPSALECSHRTNDRIRAFQDADSSSAGIRDILGKIPSKGGSRTVEFTVGAGALVGLGFPGSFAAGLRAGANFKLFAEISVPTGGGPLTTTFRIGGGVEVKALFRGLPLSEVASVKVDAGVEGSAEHFVTRTYATVEDLILDARRNRLALARTVFGYIGAGFCKLGGLIGKLGCKAFRWMGRRSDEIKQTASEYLDLLKHRGVVGSLDQFLARRANPMVVGERRGVLLTGSAGAQASGNVAGFVDLGANASISRSIEVGVSSTAFVPAARTIRASADPRALLRAGPGGGDPAELPPAEDYDALAAPFAPTPSGPTSPTPSAPTSSPPKPSTATASSPAGRPTSSSPASPTPASASRPTSTANTSWTAPAPPSPRRSAPPARARSATPPYPPRPATSSAASSRTPSPAPSPPASPTSPAGTSASRARSATPGPAKNPSIPAPTPAPGKTPSRPPAAFPSPPPPPYAPSSTTSPAPRSRPVPGPFPAPRSRAKSARP